MQDNFRALVDSERLPLALARWCDALEAAAPELNRLDAQLGDGDLGTTLAKCAANVRELLGQPGGGLGDLFKGCAQACARASGSSFGTLLAVAFLSAAKSVGERDAIDREGLVAVLERVQEALLQRGGAAPGDKTMVDSLAAIAASIRRSDPHADAQALRIASLGAAAEALDAFRDRPNRIGRARMFAERSVGLDDPGMVAVLRMIQAA